MRAAFIGGFWSRNIGNSFYNIGTEIFLKKIGVENVFFIPDPPQWEHPELNSDLDIIGLLDVDVVILTGPCLNLRLHSIYSRIFDKLKQRGVPFGFLSAGMSLYDEGEARFVADFLQEYCPKFLFTRDLRTYELLGRHGLRDIRDGICLSFYLSDLAGGLPSLATPPYALLGFDEAEPVLAGSRLEGFSTLAKESSFFMRPKPIPCEFIDGLPVLRIRNDSSALPVSKIYSRPNSYHSDIPYGHLTLIKNSKFVLSERVHTCAAALALGTPVQYISHSPRSREQRFSLFANVGASDIQRKPIQLDSAFVSERKNRLETDFTKVLQRI
jgi:hypothetical protein